MNKYDYIKLYAKNITYGHLSRTIGCLDWRLLDSYLSMDNHQEPVMWPECPPLAKHHGRQ